MVSLVGSDAWASGEVSMELTASHAIQGIMVLATVAGGYAVVKSNLSRVMQDLEDHIKPVSYTHMTLTTTPYG